MARSLSDHPMYEELGKELKLTLHANSYDWRFVSIAGSSFADAGSANCH